MPLTPPERLLHQDPGNQSLTFIPCLLPPLASGEYCISASQTVEIGGVEQDTFKSTQGFVVLGERYRLPPTFLNSQSPQNGARGDFSRQLPHVVLNTATLPWQRSPSVKPTAEDEPPPSWLAVLLFDENDPPPAPQQLTVANLLGKDTLFFPQRSEEPGELGTDPVTVIDVDIDLFNAIAPSLNDLRWNAHVRRVAPQAKASLDGSLPPLDYAVVVGNRLPAPGHSSVAHLVSLENFATYLPGDEGEPSKALPDGTRTVRLVSLANWTFNCRDGQQDFTQLFRALEPAALRMPWNKASAQDAGGDKQVENAFGLGYSAMNHALRNGEQSVSWYRGPLLPVSTTAMPKPSASHPDELLRYDPASGMFDVSYSAAWQLGRLLALQNSSFASALYRWKLGHTQQQLQAWENNDLDAALADLSSSGAPGQTTESRVEQVLSNLLKKAVDELGKSIGTGKN
ncbi:hypothetical protein PSCICO_01560 [Pseudomonas cichorii]|uniref:Uncharacterized protein n=1 Tax=Pseudomonas serbiensis TaxID=3064350 RepID=A0ABT9CN30_9PSED|nr:MULTISPECIES: hypothetical protein [Pseudomonas]MDO7926908.1 hypothetical protein [Pseudomonas sp. KFB-138]GFM84757.1 hypothetical protein PSCICO_01560 [Pseudomonas cichorii]